jgi:hypothetical protein
MRVAGAKDVELAIPLLSRDKPSMINSLFFLLFDVVIQAIR